MSITADMIRGHTDTIILRQLIEKDSYGYEINKAVQEKNRQPIRTQRGYPLYGIPPPGTGRADPLLLGDETTGARRRYYTITEEGRAQYQAAVAEWARTKDLIDKLIL